MGWGDYLSHPDTEYTPYMCCIDFSYPYFTGGWSLMSQVWLVLLAVLQ